MNRGYCGIGVVGMKREVNYGTLFRSAMNFGADFTFLIGRRFHRQSSDTVASWRHVPLYEYQTVEDFLAHRPYDCQLIGIEITADSHNICNFCHPERAMYVLGPEDGSLPTPLVSACQYVVSIPTSRCLNVSVAGSIVLYDRKLKEAKQ